ncbi:unnamed protein product [Closterium sp. NIES-54]
MRHHTIPCHEQQGCTHPVRDVDALPILMLVGSIPTREQLQQQHPHAGNDRPDERGQREGERGQREGERGQREGERGQREGERVQREGERGQREGERVQREGERVRVGRDEISSCCSSTPTLASAERVERPR